MKDKNVRIKVKGKMKWAKLSSLAYGKTYYDTLGHKRIKKKPSEQTQRILAGIEETKKMRKTIAKAKKTAKEMIKSGFATRSAKQTLWELEHEYKDVKGKHGEKVYEKMTLKKNGTTVMVKKRTTRSMKEQYEEAERYLGESLTQDWLHDTEGRKEWASIRLNPQEWDEVWNMLMNIGYDYDYFRANPSSYDALQENINLASRILGKNDLRSVAYEADRLTDNLLSSMNEGSDEIEF